MAVAEEGTVNALFTFCAPVLASDALRESLPYRAPFHPPTLT